MSQPQTPDNPITNEPLELGAILTKMVENTTIIITKDLPSLLQREEVYKIRRHHKDDILKNLPKAKEKITQLINNRVAEAKEDAALAIIFLLTDQPLAQEIVKDYLLDLAPNPKSLKSKLNNGA